MMNHPHLDNVKFEPSKMKLGHNYSDVDCSNTYSEKGRTCPSKNLDLTGWFSNLKIFIIFTSENNLIKLTYGFQNDITAVN